MFLLLPGPCSLIDNIMKANDLRSNYESKLTQIKSELYQASQNEVDAEAHASATIPLLESQLKDMMKKAGEAFSQFEGFTLRTDARLIPFRSLYKCQVGDIVRTNSRQIADFQTQFTRKVIVNDDFPEWLASANKPNIKFSNWICRVVEYSTDRIILSRYGAYI